MPCPKFTTREIIASVTLAVIGVACVRAFILFLSTANVEGAQATEWQMGAYVLIYCSGGLCLGRSIGILVHRPIAWSIFGVISALLAQCAISAYC
jgi:hypothetical protein